MNSFVSNKNDAVKPVVPSARVFRLALRSANPHPLGKLDDVNFMQVCERLNQIIQLA